MFLVYSKLSSAQIRREGKSVIKKISKWFDQNPTRKVCRAELWYGNVVHIKRKTITEQIEKAVQKALQGSVKKVS